MGSFIIKTRLEIKDLLGFEGFAVCFFRLVSVFRSVAYDVNGASAAFILLGPVRT